MSLEGLAFLVLLLFPDARAPEPCEVPSAWRGPQQPAAPPPKNAPVGEQVDEAQAARTKLLDHGSGDPERVNAAIKLLTSDRAFLVETLRGDAPPEVRRAILEAVRIRAGDHPECAELVPAVLELVREGSPLHDAAVETLRRILEAAPQPVRPQLVAALEGDDPDAAAAAVAVFEKAGDLDGVPPLLQSLERTGGRGPLAVRVARALQRLLGPRLGPDPQAWKEFWGRCAGKSRAEILREVLESERRRFARLLERKDREIVRLKREADAQDPQALIADLDDELPGVRQFAAELLARGAEEWDLEPAREKVLERLKRPDETPEVRAAMIGLLARIDLKAGRTGPDAARDGTLAQALLDASPEVVRAAVEAAQSFAVAQVREALLRALSRLPQASWPADVRVALVKAAGRLGLRGATEVLLRLLETDPEVDVRVAAVTALEKLGDGRAGEALVKALSNDADWRVRRRAASASAKVLGAKAIEPLEAALDDERPEVRSAAAATLASLGEVRVVPRLIERLAAESSAGVKTAIAEALGRLGAPEALEPLVELAAAGGGEAEGNGGERAREALREAARTAAASIADDDEERWLMLAGRYEELGDLKLAARARARRLELLTAAGADAASLADARIEAVRTALAAHDAATARRLANEGLAHVEGMAPKRQARLAMLLGGALDALEEWVPAAAAYERAIASGGLDAVEAVRAAVRRAAALERAGDPAAAWRALPRDPLPDGVSEEVRSEWEALRERLAPREESSEGATEEGSSGEAGQGGDGGAPG